MVTGMGVCSADRCILVRMRGTVSVAMVIPFPLKEIIPQGKRIRNVYARTVAQWHSSTPYHANTRPDRLPVWATCQVYGLTSYAPTSGAPSRGWPVMSSRGMSSTEAASTTGLPRPGAARACTRSACIWPMVL